MSHENGNGTARPHPGDDERDWSDPVTIGSAIRALEVLPYDIGQLAGGIGAILENQKAAAAEQKLIFAEVKQAVSLGYLNARHIDELNVARRQGDHTTRAIAIKVAEITKERAAREAEEVKARSRFESRADHLEARVEDLQEEIIDTKKEDISFKLGLAQTALDKAVQARTATTEVAAIVIEKKLGHRKELWLGIAGLLIAAATVIVQRSCSAPFQTHEAPPAQEHRP